MIPGDSIEAGRSGDRGKLGLSHYSGTQNQVLFMRKLVEGLDVEDMHECSV
jgi:hypothetical protein